MRCAAPLEGGKGRGDTLGSATGRSANCTRSEQWSTKTSAPHGFPKDRVWYSKLAACEGAVRRAEGG